MYLTLWTLRVSPLYVYRHFTLCLSPALDSIYYTLHVLDSMFIVTLCLSSIIIYVLLSMASCSAGLLGCAGTLKVATLPRVRALDHANPRKGLRGNPAGTLKVATLPRVRTLDHANPRKGLRGNPAGTPKVATLPRVRALDHANPRKGLRVTPKSCNFTSCSCARHRQSTQKVAKSCNFTSRSCARPRQSMQRVPRGADKLQLYLAFVRSTTRIHAKGCIPDRWHRCWFRL